MHCDYLSLQTLEIISQIHFTIALFENAEEKGNNVSKVDYQL